MQRAVNQWWNPESGEPARTWRMWAGQQRTPSTGQAWGAATPEVTAFVPEEATRKICGVLVARLPGKSWAPPLPTGTW